MAVFAVGYRKASVSTRWAISALNRGRQLPYCLSDGGVHSYM